jgi:hypothetical protein
MQVPARRAFALLLLLPLGACTGPNGEPFIRAGGQYSGVPDTTVGDWRQPLGTMSTDGTIRLGREAPYSGDGTLRRLTPFY